MKDGTVPLTVPVVTLPIPSTIDDPSSFAPPAQVLTSSPSQASSSALASGALSSAGAAPTPAPAGDTHAASSGSRSLGLPPWLLDNGKPRQGKVVLYLFAGAKRQRDIAAFVKILAMADYQEPVHLVEFDIAR